MTSILSPLTPRILFGTLAGRRWAVIQDGRHLGEITEVLEDLGIRYEWRTPGMVGFDPVCGTGSWWEAVQAVERRSAMPWRMRPGIPAELKISALRQEQSKQEQPSE